MTAPGTAGPPVTGPGNSPRDGTCPDGEPGGDDGEAGGDGPGTPTRARRRRPGRDGPGYQWLGNGEPWDDEDLDDDGTSDGEPATDPQATRTATAVPAVVTVPAGPAGGPGAGPQPADPGTQLAASINLTLPLATLQQLADRPGHGHGLGPLDPALARDLAAAAARSPHSTWCLTITSPQGYAIAHGCARPARNTARQIPAARQPGRAVDTDRQRS